ncbi:MAG: carboxypeptidase-like regulatory domain-containing protein [Armatimonadota bacterium]|jgi:hypothetical protein
MAARSQDDGQAPWLVLVTATTVGAVAVLASILASGLLISDAATEAAALERMASFIYWTQPFIYVMAGLLAGSSDSRWGPVRAPIIGVFLASICLLALRKQALMPQDGNMVAYLMTAGALFALGGAMIAPLLKDHIGKAVGGIIVLGIVALILAFLSQGTISGRVQRDVITRVAGQAAAWVTVGVPDVSVALLDDQETLLYTSKTNRGGYYRISGVPIGEYTLRIWDPETPAVLTHSVEVDRSITGGTRWQVVPLPTLTEETGPLFE